MDMDIEELDKLPDNRPSGFWKLTWTQVAMRLLLWVVVVYINEQGYVNPHHEKFIFADYKMEKIDIRPFLELLW
jgi:hypothetical protein